MEKKDLKFRFFFSLKLIQCKKYRSSQAPGWSGMEVYDFGIIFLICISTLIFKNFQIFSLYLIRQVV
jgi:hypothetical protein